MRDKPTQRVYNSMPQASAGDASDAELIALICESDHRAFEQLYRRYYQRLFRFAYRITRRFDQTEEIINDALYVVWKKASTWRQETVPSTWIFGIAYKKCLKSLAERPRAEHLNIEEADIQLPGVQDSGLKNLEIEDWISVAFSHLPAEQRAVLELTYYHGLHYKEIATIMDCPENTVKTRIFHARKKIQALFPDLAEGSGDSPLGQPS
ncbi:MAG: RNA polymerase sigma factor [Methylococcaceae bacterium]|nr:RNA polymerase sigma factor [Methylococcaceae bacterium]